MTENWRAEREELSRRAAETLEGRIAGAERQLESLRAELADIRHLAAGAPAAAVSQPPPAPRRPGPARPAPPRPAQHTPAPPTPIQIGPSRSERLMEGLRGKSAAWVLACAGGVVTALGIVLLFALAMNRGWIGPGARVAIGAAASSLVFGAGIWARRRFGATHSALAAVGAGIAGGYATLFAAAALYDLVPPPAALVAAAAVAAVGVVASLAFRSELLAGLGLIGAMLSPVGVYGGEVTLSGTAFATVVLAASGLVAVRLRWTRLSFAATIASLPQFTALAGESTDSRLVALGAAFAVVYLAMAIGHQHASGSDGLARLPAWLTLLSAYVAGAGLAQLYESPRREGVALLAVAVLYGAVAATLMRVARLRELGVLVAVGALTIGAGATADLLGGRTLAIVWALEAGALAWLARRLRDPRFQLTALAYFALALGDSVAVEEWQRALFVLSPHPAAAWPTLVALVAGAAALGWFAPAFAKRDVPREGVFGLLAPVFDVLARLQPAVRVLGLATAAVFTLITMSLGTLAAAVRLGPSPTLGFDRGQVAVDVLWAAAGLAAVWIGTRRGTASVARIGWLLLVATLVKLVGYDFDHLVRPELSLAMLVVGSAFLLAADAVRRVRASTVAAVLVSLPLLVGGATDLVRGQLWSADADGLALLVVAAAYGALASGCFRSARNFSTLLWVTSLGLVAAAWPVLVSGGWLVLAWAACAAALAVLSAALGEKRFLPAAYGFLGLALGHVLTVETRPEELFRAEPHPGGGVAALAVAVAAAAVVALVCRRTAGEQALDPNRGRYARPGAGLEADQGRIAAMTLAAGMALAVFAGSLVILELAQTVSSGAVHTDFQRGHVAVSAFWGVLGLALLYLGLVRGSGWLRSAGFVAFGVTVGKIFLYDLSNLSAMARALSFLGVGAVLLLGGFFYQRLSAELEDRRRPVNAGA